jgi:hypothetical protein
MPLMRQLLLSLLLFCGWHLVVAEEVGDDPAPPPMPAEQMQSIEFELPDGSLMEPEVTIRARDDGTITEYRLNGRLLVVKIQPKGAPAYYLRDSDGDGELDSRHSRLEPRILVPHWILFQW